MREIVDKITGVNHFPDHHYVFPDLRDAIFQSIASKRVTAGLYADDAGLIVGIPDFKDTATELGLEILFAKEDTSRFASGEVIAKFTGTAKQIAKTELLLVLKPLE